MQTEQYDIAIAGGGLAGLALVIQSAKAGYRTIVFEKENYPYHKVCGEYISMESWDFLQSLGLPLEDLTLPIINKLEVSAPNGSIITHALPLGGFGISRYKLDAMLADIARKENVVLMEQSKVTDIQFSGDHFIVLTGGKEFTSKVAVSSFGKRSNLDVKWKRPFTRVKAGKLNNYIGVKYHINTDHPPDLISLHNFENGYCGISQIEDGKYCLCYLTSAENLSNNENNIKKMEENVLYKNPHLKKIFLSSTFLFDNPVTISQISFQRKEQVNNHMLMIGDAAGMITPLCGNGMSMALHGSKMAFNHIDTFLKGMTTRNEMEKNYQYEWQKHFSGRLRTGRMVQSFFGNPAKTNFLVSALRPFPSLTKALVRLTHGKPF